MKEKDTTSGVGDVGMVALIPGFVFESWLSSMIERIWDMVKWVEFVLHMKLLVDTQMICTFLS